MKYLQFTLQFSFSGLKFNHTINIKYLPCTVFFKYSGTRLKAAHSLLDYKKLGCLFNVNDFF